MSTETEHGDLREIIALQKHVITIQEENIRRLERERVEPIQATLVHRSIQAASNGHPVLSSDEMLIRKITDLESALENKRARFRQLSKDFEHQTVRMLNYRRSFLSLQDLCKKTVANFEREPNLKKPILIILSQFNNGLCGICRTYEMTVDKINENKA